MRKTGTSGRGARRRRPGPTRRPAGLPDTTDMSVPAQHEQRAAALRARRSLDAATRDAASRRIAAHFLRSSLFHAASSIGCFVSMPDEVDTTEILARAWSAGKRIYCPVVARRRRLRFVEVTRETTLVRRGFGLLEPEAGAEIEPLELDVVVVPLTAFDPYRHRIGMGGGYYDCTFAALRKRRTWLKPKLVGVAFECQKVPKIKANSWDVPLFEVITERHGMRR